MDSNVFLMYRSGGGRPAAEDEPQVSRAATAANRPVALRELQDEFPQYEIWRELAGDRSRFVARSQLAGVRPHTLVTPDADELRTVLSAGSGGLA